MPAAILRVLMMQTMRQAMRCLGYGLCTTLSATQPMPLALRLSQQESDNDTPESQLEWKEDEQWLRQRIEQLPPREMQVMRLRQTERRTNEQIAAILGISKDSVATMLSSARRKLFNQIKERNRT